MKGPQYYLTKISELADPTIQQVLLDLCALQHPAWDLKDHHDHRCFIFLTHYFKAAGRVSLNHVVPGSLLDCKVSACAGTELHDFCRELATQKGKLFEGEENKKLLPFLQGIFGKGVPRRRGGAR